ncbi:prolyl oligopeptidase family serine peptidase [Croceibacterium sp. TMG7-5b_MA50]|uniref:S9 family peptidase n=1 Tax=Croceibacterium sp. TMG7-5b_MA50 TaxID=3121290 RepID=UPI003221CED7
MRSFLLLLAAVLLSPAHALAQSSAEAAATDLLARHMAAPFAGGLVGADDAPVFAWVENRGGARNVLVATPGQAARAVTAYTGDEGIEISGVALSPDGRRVAFVRGGDAEWPGRSAPNTGLLPIAPRPTVWLVPAAGGDPVRLGEGHAPVFSADGRQVAWASGGTAWLHDGAEARRIAQLPGSVDDLSFSPDGTRLLLRDVRGGHALVGVLPLDAGSLNGGPLVYATAALAYQGDPVWSPDGRHFAFIQFREPPGDDPSAAGWWSVRVADAATGAVRTVWSAAGGEGARFYGTRGQNLYWTANGTLLFSSEASGFLHVLAVPAAGGTARDLTPDAGEVEHFLPAADALIYSAGGGDPDGRQVWRVPLTGGTARRMTPPEQLAFMPVAGGDTLAALAADWDSPVHPVLVEGMAPLSAALDLPAMVEPEIVTYEAADGVAVHAQLFRAAGEGQRPALVFVHGGPRRQMLPGFHPYYYYHNAYLMNQALARAGYHVLSVNYRSGTNYGRAFREAPETGRGGAAEYRDVLAGGRWLGAQGFVDPDRIGIWGGSWGGYLTALALARDSDLFAAGVDLHGVHTLLRPAPTDVAPAEAERARQLQWDSSPMAALDRWRSPVLLVHGDDDANVPFSQSLLLARELHARGVPFEELAWPNERHDFFRNDHWLATYRASIDFLDRHLKGPAR